MPITTFFVDKVSEFRAPTTVDPSTGFGTPACFSKVALAHVGYIVCIPFAAVETAILLIARVFFTHPWHERKLRCLEPERA